MEKVLFDLEMFASCSSCIVTVLLVQQRWFGVKSWLIRGGLFFWKKTKGDCEQVNRVWKKFG